MVTTHETYTSRNDQQFEKFDIRNFLNQLVPTKEKGRFLCPACGSHNFTYDKSEPPVFTCWDNRCDRGEIREILNPWEKYKAEQKGDSYTPSPRRTAKKPKLIKPKPALIPSNFTLLRLTEPPIDIPQPQQLTSRPPDKVPGSATQIIYSYSDNQWVARYQWPDASKEKGHSKTFKQCHRREDGTVEMRKGEKPWTAYRLDEAIAASKSVEGTPTLLQVEGEKCVEILRLNQIAAISFQGSAWSKKSILPEYERAKQSGIGLIIFLYDNDPAGLKKAEICSESAAEVGIGFIAINPLSVCPDLPLKGDIEQILGQMETPEFIRKLEEQIHAAIEERSRQRVKEDQESFFDSDTTDNNDYKKRDFIDFSELSEDDRAWQQRKRWRSPASYQGEIGWWKEREKDGEPFFDPACNFDFRVEGEIEDADGGGLVLLVTRSIDNREVRVIINSTDYTKCDVFVDALKRAFKVGIVCNLDKKSLNNLIHTRLHQYRTTRKGQLFKRIDRYGQQADGTWVFADRQYKKDGTPTNENESRWVFNPSLGKEDFIPAPELAPENPLALKRLVDASRAFLGTKNVHQILLTMGWVVAGLNFQEIFAQNSLFPVLNCFGVPGSFKTVAAEVGASLVGKNWPELGILGRVSTSALYELGSKLGSIPFFLDDPERSPENEELVKNWYNCKPRRVRGNQQTPRSPMGITSNHIIGGEQPATFTRITRVPYDVVTGGDKAAFQQLKLAQAEASGAFPQLIALGYPKKAIDEIESELLQYLPHAHARIAQSLAIVTWYAQKVVDMTGGTENIKQWVIENCCGSENDSDASGDSLKDYLNKILTLESENLIGDWNFKRNVERDGQLYHALYAHDAWKLLDHRFKPATYNERSLKALVIKAGGITDVTSRFSCDRSR
ncbi:toprim domain-containing protein [Nostoc sp.]